MAIVGHSGGEAWASEFISHSMERELLRAEIATLRDEVAALRAAPDARLVAAAKRLHRAQGWVQLGDLEPLHPDMETDWVEEFIGALDDLGFALDALRGAGGE